MKLQNHNYYIIHGWMINILNLKGTALEIFAIIYSFSKDGTSWFNGSLSYLICFTNTTKPTVLKALNMLISKNFIIKESTRFNGQKSNNYRVNYNTLNTILTEADYSFNEKLLNLPGKKNIPEFGQETIPNINSIYNDIVYILNYLNEKAHTNYHPSDIQTQYCISARYSEGYKLEDFLHVIDSRINAWLGTKAEMHLKPKTIFGSNFKKYLNETSPKVKKNSGFQIIPEGSKDPLEGLI